MHSFTNSFVKVRRNYLGVVSVICGGCRFSRQRLSIVNRGLLGGGVRGIDDDRSLRPTAVFAAAGLVSLTASIPGVDREPKDHDEWSTQRNTQHTSFRAEKYPHAIMLKINKTGNCLRDRFAHKTLQYAKLMYVFRPVISPQIP